MLILNLTKYTIKENKEIKLRKILRKSQPDFQHYVKKIEAEPKSGSFMKKNVKYIIRGKKLTATTKPENLSFKIIRKHV